MGALRTKWQLAKKWSEDCAAGKIPLEGIEKADSSAIKTVMKTFTGGFGPTLDKLEKAYKDKKDADVKKYADAALKIAEIYNAKIQEMNKHGFTGSPYAYMHGNLSFIITKVSELKAKGITTKADI